MQKQALWLHRHALWCSGGSAVSTRKEYKAECLSTSQCHKRYQQSKSNQTRKGANFHIWRVLFKIKDQEWNLGTWLLLKITRAHGNDKTEGGIRGVINTRSHKTLRITDSGLTHHPPFPFIWDVTPCLELYLREKRKGFVANAVPLRPK